MRAERHLCSQLATLAWKGGSQIVNLEEIWADGAMLECEAAVPAGVQAQIRWDDFQFWGEVSAVTEDEFGWQVEIQFSPLTLWSPERARPAHMLPVPDR